MGKRYPLKAVRTLKRKKEEVEEEENYSLRTEHTLEHKALSGTDSILCARCKSILWEGPERGGVSTSGDTLAKESDFICLCRPDGFRSMRAHQKLNGNLTGSVSSADSRHWKTTS